MSKQEYVSCKYIEGGLTFMAGYLSFCCLARRLNNTNLPVITKYNGAILPIEVILDERKRLNEKILKNI